MQHQSALKVTDRINLCYLIKPGRISEKNARSHASQIDISCEFERLANLLLMRKILIPMGMVQKDEQAVTHYARPMI